MDDTDHDKREAELLARLEAEREQRIAEKSRPGRSSACRSHRGRVRNRGPRPGREGPRRTSWPSYAPPAKPAKLCSTLTVVVTGVVRPGEAPTLSRCRPRLHFPHGRMALGRPCRRRRPRRTRQDEVVEEEAEKQPPVIETSFCVQIRACRDDDDPGEIIEGCFASMGQRDGHRRDREVRWQSRHAEGRGCTRGGEEATAGKRPRRRDLIAR